MQPSGWFIMLISVGAVLSLVSFCLFRVLTLPESEMEDLEGPLTIDTGDTSDAD
ncbi:hypothetical protein [Bythopirellula goksoeyrii]|uniref:Uncharacterized protein n=1 Tax=Bythopirellula goksoeyrii TaxID=1400387 RepID=A0A5B9QN58_9BACT|nr:hypothetical protein [Bythopirellula goksoeyrii]QEG35561.1 hypothetical protein Pr1d_28620 [Bythopirellula goksoeyrii]